MIRYLVEIGQTPPSSHRNDMHAHVDVRLNSSFLLPLSPCGLSACVILES